MYQIRTRGRTVAQRKFLNGAATFAIEYEKRLGVFCQPLSIIKLDRSGLPASGVFSWDVRCGRAWPALEMRGERLINLRDEFTLSEVVARRGFGGGTRAAGDGRAARSHGTTTRP